MTDVFQILAGVFAGMSVTATVGLIMYHVQHAGHGNWHNHVNHHA